MQQRFVMETCTIHAAQKKKKPKGNGELKTETPSFNVSASLTISSNQFWSNLLLMESLLLLALHSGSFWLVGNTVSQNRKLMQLKTKGTKRKDWVLSRSAPDPTHCSVVSALAQELFRAGVKEGPHLLGTTHS